jgi:ABC-type multidrug transport system ATPase subunit
MADRVGVIRKGELVALGDKKALMAQMGQRTLKITLDDAISEIPLAWRSGAWRWRMRDTRSAIGSTATPSIPAFPG